MNFRFFIPFILKIIKERRASKVNECLSLNSGKLRRKQSIRKHYLLFLSQGLLCNEYVSSLTTWMYYLFWVKADLRPEFRELSKCLRVFFKSEKRLLNFRKDSENPKPIDIGGMSINTVCNSSCLVHEANTMLFWNNKTVHTINEMSLWVQDDKLIVNTLKY